MSTVRRFSSWWFRVVSPRVVIAVVVGFLAFGAVVLPAQAERTERFAGSEGTPDTSLIYTPEDLYAAAERFGDEGREEFVQARYTFDLVWPLVYATFLCVLLTPLLRRLFPPGSRWRLLNLVPWLGLLADYLENLCTSIVMVRYPETTAVAASLAPVATFVKWVFTGGSFVLLAGLAVAALVQRKPASA